MKIVHINTFTTGGAAKAAIRQHLALLDYGLDSTILFLDGNNKGIPRSIVLGAKLSFFKRIFRKLGLITFKRDKNEILRKKIKGVYEHISFPETDISLHNLKIIKEADIINLHWVADFVDYPSFFKNVSAPVLWTLHDMNPIMGLYHYPGDEINSKGINKIIDKDLVDIKENAILQCNKIEFIGPSLWIYNKVKEHSFFKRFKLHYVPYSLDTEIFSLYNKEAIRKELRIDVNSKVLLFVSENINNRRKGFDLLLKALEKLNYSNITICIIGSIKEVSFISNFQVKAFGHIYDEVALSKIYAASDAFILPSREDNLPNVMLEALMAGTPVLSFKLGGMVDSIIENKNGMLSDNVSSEGLKEIIERFLINGVEWNQREIREHALNHYSPCIQASKLIEVYKNIL